MEEQQFQAQEPTPPTQEPNEPASVGKVIKIVRNIFASTALIVIVAMMFIVIMKSRDGDTTLKNIPVNNDYPLSPSSDNKIQEVKNGFPQGLPLPPNSQVIEAVVDENSFINNESYILLYVSEQDSDILLAEYSAAMSQIGLQVGDIRDEGAGKKTLRASTSSVIDSDTLPATMYIEVIEQANGSTRVTIGWSTEGRYPEDY